MSPVRAAEAAFAFLLLAASTAHAGDERCADAYVAAQSLREQQTFRAAREQLIVCSNESCAAFIKKDCVQWLEEIEAAMPSLALQVRGPAGHDVADATVIIDDAPGARVDGRAIILDPGEHLLRVEAPGYAPNDVRIVARAGEKNRLVALTLVAVAPAIVVKAPVPTTPDGAPLTEPPAGKDSSSSSTLRTLGIVGLVAGGVGLGIGGYFGVRAIGKQSDAHCPDNMCSPRSDRQSLLDAQSAGTASTVFFIAGGVLAAAGLTLLLLPGTRRNAAREAVPRVVAGPSGLNWRF